jgi:hypothetical protein
VEFRPPAGYEMRMATYRKIDEVSESPKYGNCGPEGWAFTLWGDTAAADPPHRDLVERFAAEWPRAAIRLPEYDRDEDIVECDAVWNGARVWVYYETLLNYLTFWSPDRDAIEGFRAALLPVVK